MAVRWMVRGGHCARLAAMPPQHRPCLLTLILLRSGLISSPHTAPSSHHRQRRCGLVLALGAFLLGGLVWSWATYQRPLLAPTMPVGVAYAGPLMLFGQPQAAPDLSKPETEWSRAGAAQQAKGLHITRPIWRDLGGDQQRVLAGLEPIWPYISSAEKRRWLALAHETRALDDAQTEQVIANIHTWGLMTEAERQAIRTRLQPVDTEQLAAIGEAWQAYAALDANARQALLQSSKTTAKPGTRARPSGKLVKIRAAAQTQPGLSNLPKIPLQPVRYARNDAAADSVAPSASQITPVEVAQPPAAAKPTQTPATATPPRVTYWHGIPITPPATAAVYVN